MTHWSHRLNLDCAKSSLARVGEEIVLVEGTRSSDAPGSPQLPEAICPGLGRRLDAQELLPAQNPQ